MSAAVYLIIFGGSALAFGLGAIPGLLAQQISRESTSFVPLISVMAIAVFASTLAVLWPSPDRGKCGMDTLYRLWIISAATGACAAPLFVSFISLFY